MLVALGWFSATSAIGQTEPQPPRDVIKLMDWSDQSGEHGTVITCGRVLAEARYQRDLTRQLVKMGTPAIRAIEEALDSFETRGEKSEIGWHAGWLLLAYAQIKGPAAYPRLHKLIGNPKLGAYADSGWITLIALAFGLTSYVSSFQGMGDPDSRSLHGAGFH